MLYFPWSAIAWFEFWSAMGRVWLEPMPTPSTDSRVIPFPATRVRSGAALGHAAGAQVVRLSV
jgi:hypothetical protein